MFILLALLTSIRTEPGYSNMATTFWQELPLTSIALLLGGFAILGVAILSILIFSQAKDLAYLRSQVDHMIYQQAIDEEHAEVD
jgi:hypothetical protein